MKDETKNTIMAFKKRLVNDIKFIKKIIGKNDKITPATVKLINEALHDGIFTGSYFVNYYNDINDPDMDIDVFVPVFTQMKKREILEKYPDIFSNSFDTTKDELDIFDPDLEIVDFTAGAYEASLNDLILSAKMLLKNGNLKYKLNIIYVDVPSKTEPMNIIANFDFEVTNWYYSDRQNKLEITERAIELLEESQFEFTPNYARFVRDMINNAGKHQNDFPIILERYERYVNKKLNPTQETQILIKTVEEVHKLT